MNEERGNIFKIRDISKKQISFLKIINERPGDLTALSLLRKCQNNGSDI